MKELSIEQKATAYEDLLKKAKQYYDTENDVIALHFLEELFPELKESEDERIRKEILQSIRDNMVVIHKDKCIAWLEKQEGCEYIKKDWLEHIKQSWYKEGFIDGKYSGGTSKEWTINDVAIFKEIIDFLENGTAKLQHDLTKYANWLKIQFTPIEKQGKQKSVWHNEDEEPQRGSLILLIMQSGTPIVAKIIEPNHTFNHGERWAYIDDLLEKQGEQNTKQVSIWKHWKDGIAGNGDGKTIYLIKNGYTYSLSSCLSYECDYIELSELDKLMIEKQGEQKPVIEMKSPEESLGISSEEYNDIVNECLYGESNSSDKIEPKFHEGDWVVNKLGNSWHIDSFDKKNYQVSDGK